MRIRTLSIRIAVAASLVVAAACSSPKDATKDNFAAAINRALGKDQACLRLRLPAQVPLAPSAAGSDEERQFAMFDALVADGLLAAQRLEVPDELVFWGKGKPKTHPVNVYELTDKGRATQQIDQAQTYALIGIAGLCYGAGEVTEIVNFTPPSSMFGGATTSAVQYRYKIRNVADWATRPAVAKVDPALAAAAAGRDLFGQMDLLLTDNGWQTGAEFALGNRSAPAAAP